MITVALSHFRGLRVDTKHEKPQGSDDHDDGGVEPPSAPVQRKLTQGLVIGIPDIVGESLIFLQLAAPEFIGSLICFHRLPCIATLGNG